MFRMTAAKWKVKAILVALVVCLSYFSAYAAQARTGEPSEKRELLAIGVGAIVKGNLPSAKKKAIDQALMKGVETYVLHMLGSRGIVNSFERVTEEIIPGARGEVKKFHILAAQQVDSKYKVLVRLEVNEAFMRERLREIGALGEEAPRVKVLFLVSETREGDVTYWWQDPEVFRNLSALELALHKVFHDRGFSPVNRTLNPPDLANLDHDLSPDLQNEDALELGSLFSADVVICGRCEINEKNEVSLRLRALDVYESTQICKAFIVEQLRQELTDTGQDVQILQGVVNRSAATLAPCIMGAVASKQGEIHHLEITLAGMSRPKQFWVFRDFLNKEIIGIKSVIPSRISGNAVSARVAFHGDGNQFVKQVLKHQSLPFPLLVGKPEGKEIVFSLQ